MGYDLLLSVLERRGLVLALQLLSEHVQVKVLSWRPWKAEQAALQSVEARPSPLSTTTSSSSSLLQSGSAVEVKWGSLPDVAAVQSAARKELMRRLKEEQQAAREEKKRREQRMQENEEKAMDTKEDGEAAPAREQLSAAAPLDEDADEARRRRGRRVRRGRKERRERGAGRRLVGVDDDVAKLASEQIPLFTNTLHETALELPRMSDVLTHTTVLDLSYSQHTRSSLAQRRRGRQPRPWQRCLSPAPVLLCLLWCRDSRVGLAAALRVPLYSSQCGAEVLFHHVSPHASAQPLSMTDAPRALLCCRLCAA